MSKAGWLIGGALVVAGAATAAWLLRDGGSEPQFRTETVDRGDVVATVTASGTLSAVTTVKVGSQVSGIIAALHADFNSPVTKGQLLAELDPTPFQAAVDQRRADLERARIELRNTETAFARTKRLVQEQIASQTEYDNAKANRDSAAASVAQSKATLDQALSNLDNTRIASPIDGVVVDRQIDLGQTVAASFQAPTLFTIAQDLTKMQVLTNIDESDIGGVKVGQDATFTVDAFPDATFRGTVSQVRLSPQTVQNVVTYPVLLDVDNPEGKLKPGMTANVQIPVDTRRDVLRVPNAALRFRPDTAMIVAEAGEKAGGKRGEKGAGAPGAGGPSGESPVGTGPTPGPRGEGGGGRGASGGGREGGRRGAGGMGGGGGRGGARGSVVYVPAAKGKVRAVSVRTLLTDGTNTAIESRELKEGHTVVVGLVTARATTSTGPGTPGMSGGRPPRGMRM